MEVERIDENVAVDENAKPVADEGAAGDAATSHSERLRRKNKKYARTNSKEGAVNAVTPLPKYRSWKNSRRPRNGHGRGLPKKGEWYIYLHFDLHTNFTLICDKKVLEDVRQVKLHLGHIYVTFVYYAPAIE